MTKIAFYGVDPGKATGVASCIVEGKVCANATSLGRLVSAVDVVTNVQTQVLLAQTLVDVVKNAINFFHSVTAHAAMEEATYHLNIESFGSRDNKLRGETMEYSRAFVYATMGLHFSRLQAIPTAGALRMWDPSTKSHKQIKRLGIDFMTGRHGTEVTTHEVDAVMMLGNGLQESLR